MLRDVMSDRDDEKPARGAARDVPADADVRIAAIVGCAELHRAGGQRDAERTVADQASAVSIRRRLLDFGDRPGSGDAAGAWSPPLSADAHAPAIDGVSSEERVNAFAFEPARRRGLPTHANRCASRFSRRLRRVRAALRDGVEATIARSSTASPSRNIWLTPLSWLAAAMTSPPCEAGGWRQRRRRRTRCGPTRRVLAHHFGDEQRRSRSTALMAGQLERGAPPRPF